MTMTGNPGEMKIRVAKDEKIRPTIMRAGRSPIAAHADAFRARHYRFHLTDNTPSSWSGRHAEDLVADMPGERGK
jgi:hypothetical protein